MTILTEGRCDGLYKSKKQDEKRKKGRREDLAGMGLCLAGGAERGKGIFAGAGESSRRKKSREEKGSDLTKPTNDAENLSIPRSLPLRTFAHPCAPLQSFYSRVDVFLLGSFLDEFGRIGINGPSGWSPLE